MAKTAAIISDDESEPEVQAARRKRDIAKKGKGAADEEMDEDEDGSEPEEEEYEIENILDAKHGTFPDGRIGYLVKWRGYGEEHNSWVDEKDAGNAHLLIEDFWRRDKKEKKVGRKSTTAAPKITATLKTPAAKPRKSSTTRDESSEVEVPAKKRGRPSNVSKAAQSQELDDDEVEIKMSQKKKPRQSRKSTGKPSKDAMEVDEAEEFRDVKSYRHLPSWEHIVQTIDTVERGEDGQLVVYFTLKGKGRAKEDSSVCKEKMPNKLLEFYENNLRWKQATEEEEEE